MILYSRCANQSAATGVDTVIATCAVLTCERRMTMHNGMDTSLTLYGGPTLTTPFSPAHLLLANWSHPISRLSPVDIMGRQPIGLAEVPRGVVSPSPFPMRGWGKQLWRHSSTPAQEGPPTREPPPPQAVGKTDQ